MEKLQEHYAIDIHWRSFELRPAGSPPMPPEYRRRIEASRPMFNKRAREQYGLEINSGPFGINSRPALVAEKYAESQGKGETFHKADYYSSFLAVTIIPSISSAVRGSRSIRPPSIVNSKIFFST